MHTKRRVGITVVAGLTPLLLMGPAPATTAGPFGATTGAPMMHGWCASAPLPVTLGAGKARDEEVYTTYCVPFTWARGQRKIDILTEGATYSGMYWRWPQASSVYSYVDKTLGAGRAVVTYDRLGAGRSSHPASTDITIEADAYVLHEIVQAVHRTGYRNVTLIGHSYGSGITLREAGTYNDASRVVATGYLHTPRNDAVASSNYPANQDSRFSGRGLDDGYLTTKPGVRQANFYSSAADPAVISFDEAHKDLVSSTGFGGYFADRSVPAGSNLTNMIREPVMLIDGQRDVVFCFNPASLDCTDAAAVKAHELPYYTGIRNRARDMNFAVVTVPATGHDLALHPSANQSFNAISEWIKEH